MFKASQMWGLMLFFVTYDSKLNKFGYIFYTKLSNKMITTWSLSIITNSQEKKAAIKDLNTTTGDFWCLQSAESAAV